MSASVSGLELDVKALAAHVERELRRFEVPGVEVVVVRDGAVLFAGGFGRRDVERDLPVTSRTVFAHGSTGKGFTSFLVGQLVDDGLLKLRTAMKEDPEKGRRVVPGTRPAHPLAEYAGRYEHPGYGTLEVEAADDALSMALGAMRFEVTHRHYETFDLKLSGLGELRFTANFVTDESGSVSEARCSFEPAVETLRFTRVADSRLFDLTFLEGLAGRYTLGPATVDITVEPGPKLVGHQNGARFELVPGGGMRFKVPMVPGLTLEFVLDSAGRATAIATAQGTLTRAD